MLCVNGITYNMGLAHSPSIISDGLVLYLDAANRRSYSGSGNTWYDLSKNFFIASKINSPNYNTTSGGGFTFDGSGTNYFSLDNYASAVNVTSGTVGGWIKFNTAPSSTNYVFVSYGGNGTGGGFNLYYSGLDGPNFGICFDYWASIYYGNTLTYANSANYTGRNIYIIATWNSNLIQLYLDGNLIVSTNVSGTMTTQNYLRISSEYNRTRGVNGSVYNFQLYNRALTEQEILQNYNATRKRFGL